MNGRTSAGAVLAAIIVGAAVGSVLVSGWLFVPSLFGELPELAPLVAAAGFVVAAPLWVGGLLLVGLPVWTVLHLCGARSRWIGTAAGAVLSLPALVPGLVVWGSALSDEAMGLAVALASQAGTGAVVGWVVVHVAYEREGTLA
ncbi:hypothetical protein CFHF_07215 [Caulobacter flavus]|uniref:Uncharacterized protein n=1 Tax=Caulobacter flavus TaxID=1679497 RepID=A0A2N5CWB9_9CAUL|nr:hypothetical protein [Caulobacter flavus]AYV44892.1 hypothetical protein C1707_00670 [Caulobacter flavus]PLR18103.1 hypothetical protein CFHF_07215 [Caulobacter flavus]